MSENATVGRWIRAPCTPFISLFMSVDAGSDCFLSVSSRKSIVQTNYSYRHHSICLKYIKQKLQIHQFFWQYLFILEVTKFSFHFAAFVQFGKSSNNKQKLNYIHQVFTEKNVNLHSALEQLGTKYGNSSQFNEKNMWKNEYYKTLTVYCRIFST